MTLHPDLRVAVDGETVAASRYEPAAAGPNPAVVIATPYRKDDRISFGAWDPSIRYLARAGYEVVVMDLLGTGASTGWKEPFAGDEGREVAAVVEHVAAEPWCTGAVGAFGLSYGAWTTYQVAALDPDPLGAIVPVSVTPAAYRSSWTGGAFNLLKRATWPVSMYASAALPPSRRDPDGRWAAVWEERLDHLRSAEPWLFSLLEHPTEDAFWTGRRVDPADLSVPTLAACGYRDVHTAPMVEFVEAIDAPRRLLLGPWQHVYPERGRIAPVAFRRAAVAWFDRHLRDDDRGGDRDATAIPGTADEPVLYWTEREGGWADAGRWRRADRWPTLDGAAEPVTLALTPDGLRRADGYGPGDGSLDATYEYDHAVGVDSLDRVGGVHNPGVDTSVDDARSLAFETGPLDRPVELTGTGAARLRLRADTPEPTVAVRVVDVGPRGRARLVTGGYVRASHRAGHADPDPLVPGEEYVVPVDLKPKSHVFEAGRRIRVAVAAAAFPRARPTGRHGSLTLCSSPDAPSVVRFPGRGHAGGVAFPDGVELPTPDRSVATDSAFVVDATADWTTRRANGTGAATLVTESASTVDLPHGGRFERSERVEAVAARRDPTAARLDTDVRMALARNDRTVVAEAGGSVGVDHADLTTTVRVDDRTVFDERWRRDG